MICMRRFTPAGVMFAVVAVNVSTTSRGPANAFDVMKAATAAIAHVANKVMKNRVSLADIVIRPQFRDRLLEMLRLTMGRRRDPRTRLQRSELGEVVSRHRNLEAHVALVELR